MICLCESFKQLKTETESAIKLRNCFKRKFGWYTLDLRFAIYLIRRMTFENFSFVSDLGIIMKKD